MKLTLPSISTPCTLQDYQDNRRSCGSLKVIV